MCKIEEATVNSKDIFNEVVSLFFLNIDKAEAQSIAYQLVQTVWGISKTDVVGNRKIPSVNWNKIIPLINRINKNEPIQYILGEQEFYGRLFHVNSSVLIPRPETEYLVGEVAAWIKTREDTKIEILDIGTGSGCIPITLALEFNTVQAHGIDISKEVIDTAKKNASHHEVDITFYQCDIIKECLPSLQFNAVVSNPPYVMESEKPNIKPNVLDYEPHKALFVPYNNPLVFYNAILSKSKNVLVKGGLIAVEINEQFGEAVVDLFKKQHYRFVELIQDGFGKDRIVKAVR